MCSSLWNDDWQEKPKYLEKTYPSTTLSTTNPTWPDLGSNPGHNGGKPETNGLNYGAAALKGNKQEVEIHQIRTRDYQIEGSMDFLRFKINPSDTVIAAYCEIETCLASYCFWMRLIYFMQSKSRY
jgi:hypothetical protein